MAVEGKPATVNGERNAASEGERSPSRDKPYENNEKALSIIRHKVEEANHGGPIPQGNMDEPEDVATANALLPSEQAHAEETQDALEPLSLPKHTPSISPTRKKPMFSVPEEPVEDSETGAQVH